MDSRTEDGALAISGAGPFIAAGPIVAALPESVQGESWLDSPAHLSAWVYWNTRQRGMKDGSREAAF